MKEKRQNPRVGISFPVECVSLPERKEMFYTVSKDLSLGGIKILSEDFLPTGKDLRINVNLINEMASAKAKVIWCNKEPYSDRYYAGLKFFELNKRNKTNLNHLINKINHA